MSKNIEDDLPDMPENLHPEVMTDGIFVTWDKRSPSTKSHKSEKGDYHTLRGCIGFLLPIKLGQLKSRSATFLPNVMPEQLWDQVHAVSRAIMKGGGSSRDAQHPEALHTTVQRYQSSKFSLTFEEYAQMRGIATFDQ
ncbi:AMME syndrome candidate protein 1 protein [Perkinsus olseni]|uniref:AMME syndrome candidate protein 1 protein n=1 Tax=Perkinsus olseni TaxID=32597 RepID=A0A7J6M0X6_PEROL|nr:AMME syndrome candidate protein 1 protein [Perkinsus olseni]